MSDAAPLPVITPTPDERTMATLAHVLQIVGGWIAPLIIFLVKRESRFVSFHALQVLLLHAVYLVFWVMAIVVFFTVMISTAVMHAHSSGAPPVGLFVLFPLFWLGIMGMWVVILVVAIVYGVKAGNGEWAEYPVLGAVARHILKIGPGGTQL